MCTGDVATDTGGVVVGGVVVDDGRTVAAVDIVAGIVTFIALIFVTAARRRDVIHALAGASITTVVSTVAVFVHAAVVLSRAVQQIMLIGLFRNSFGIIRKYSTGSKS